MHSAQATDQFSLFKSQLRAQFGPAVYDSYFDRLKLAEAGRDHVTLTTPTRYAARVISKRYALRMQQMWSEHVSPVRRIDIKAVQELGRAVADPCDDLHAAQGRTASVAPVIEAEAVVPAEPAAGFEGVTGAAGQAPFARGMTFDRFCTNESNRLAHHAALKLLDSPEPQVTMVHGPAGRGKTHLLNAVGQEWLRRKPEARVLYLTYDALVTDVCEAFISKSLKEYRTFLQNTDLLLIDDIQMLRGRKRTQEELDCLIEKLRGAGKRVMVAGTLPPKELAETGISQRLASRLSGGLSVAVGTPDIDLTLRVARQWSAEAAELSGVTIPRKHLELVARRCRESLRELEGALSLMQVATEAEVAAGSELTDESARRLLNEHLQQTKRPITPEAILTYTTELFAVSRDDLMGRSRKQPIVRARHAFCFAVRKLTDTPLKAIGSFVGRDHTTVMHSVRTAEILAETDAVFGARITQIFDEFPVA